MAAMEENMADEQDVGGPTLINRLEVRARGAGGALREESGGNAERPALSVPGFRRGGRVVCARERERRAGSRH